jgi:hypothetical protein
MVDKLVLATVAELRCLGQRRAGAAQRGPNDGG